MLILVAILLLLAAAWLLLLRCRGNASGWEKLEGRRYAHRGLHDKTIGVPENSLAAFRRAAEHGFGVELDVHLLADGELAVFHDSSLQRMTGREGAVEELTAAQLGEYSLLGTGETIPQLCEVLRVFEGTELPLVVELKSYRGNHDALAARTMEELDKFRVPYCIESFDPLCLRWLRRSRPEVIRGQLSCDFIHGRKKPGVKEFLATKLWMNCCGVPDFIAYCRKDRKSAPLDLCRKLFGAHIVYWTLRSEDELLAAEAEGALGIFENFIPEEK